MCCLTEIVELEVRVSDAEVSVGLKLIISNLFLALLKNLFVGLDCLLELSLVEVGVAEVS